MKTKKAVLFDIDGTLVDSIDTLMSCFKKSFKEMGRNYPGDERIRRLIGSRLQGIFLTFMEEGEAMQMTQIFRKHYLKAQEKGIPLMTGALEMLKNLKANKKKIGIVTMKLAEFAKALCEDLKIAKYIDVIIGGEDVEHGKPHPEGLLKAIKKLNVKPEETIFVGDPLYDAEAAKEAGISFIGVTTGTATKKDLENFGIKKIIKSISEISNL